MSNTQRRQPRRSHTERIEDMFVDLGSLDEQRMVLKNLASLLRQAERRAERPPQADAGREPEQQWTLTVPKEGAA